MAWFTPKKPWKQKESKVEVKETQIGPNSVRFEAVKKEGGYKSPNLSAPYKFGNLSSPKKTKKSYWDTYKNVKFDDNDDYYPDRSFSGRTTYGRTPSYQRNLEKPVVTRKEFAWAPTRWSSFSFAAFTGNTDSNTNLFVKEPESYVTPSKQEIQIKLHVYSDDAIITVKELSRLFYFKMLDEKDYITENIVNIIGESAYENKKNMYSSAYDAYIPGFTPLEQATNYYQAYLDKLAIINRKDTKLAHENGVIVSFKREDFCNPLLNSQIELNPLSKSLKINILNKISLLGKLGHQFDVEKEVGETVVANSDVYKKKVMRDYSQLDRVNIYQKMLPTFNIKFLTKDLIVDVPILTNEKKQKIIILLDYSGSMSESKKQIWVNAILIDRLRYVIKGEAEVYFSYFVSSTSGLQFTHLKNAKDVEEFWKTFSNYPSGGTTDISRIVRYVADEVRGGKNLHNLKGLNLSKEKPEILIINDGQDSVNSNGFPYKVNAISLIQFSDELKNLCVKTGGKQVKVDRYEDVSCYSPEGYEKFEL